ncbi:MAG: GtrA family protein [Methylovirgula sp.]
MRARLEALVPSPFSRFVVAGGLAAAVNILSRVALSHIMSYGVAIVVAYLIGMTTAYLLMKLFVFEASGTPASHEYARFGLVNLAALVQVWLVSEGLVRWLFPSIGFSWHPDTVAHTIGVLSPVAMSYIGHKSFTFARKERC